MWYGRYTHFRIFDSFIFKTQISRLLTDVELAYDNLKARFYVRASDNCKNCVFAFSFQWNSEFVFVYLPLDYAFLIKSPNKFLVQIFFVVKLAVTVTDPRGCFWKISTLCFFFYGFTSFIFTVKNFHTYYQFHFFFLQLFCHKTWVFDCFWNKRRFH